MMRKLKIIDNNGELDPLFLLFYLIILSCPLVFNLFYLIAALIVITVLQVLILYRDFVLKNNKSQLDMIEEKLLDMGSDISNLKINQGVKTSNY